MRELRRELNATLAELARTAAGGVGPGDKRTAAIDVGGFRGYKESSGRSSKMLLRCLLADLGGFGGYFWWTGASKTVLRRCRAFGCPAGRHTAAARRTTCRDTPASS